MIDTYGEREGEEKTKVQIPGATKAFLINKGRE